MVRTSCWAMRVREPMHLSGSMSAWWRSLRRMDCSIAHWNIFRMTRSSARDGSPEKG